MGIRDKRTSGCGHAYLAALSLLLALPSPVAAQLFNIDPLRPPADIPGAGQPPQSLAPPEEPAPATKGPLLQPPTPPAAAPARTQTAPAIPSGQAALAVTARFGRDLPAINGGLDWRVYPSKPEPNGGFRLIKEEKSAAPIFTLPPGSYVVHVGFGLASTTKAVQLRAGELRPAVK